MNLSTTTLLVFDMSTDAFATSIGKGATLHKPKSLGAIHVGLIFSVIETLISLADWGLGMLASQFTLERNHWIILILLVFLGGRMIVGGVRGDNDEACDAPHRHGFWLLVIAVFATSPDAMAVGVGLTSLQVSIVTTVLAIGCATFLISALGIVVGRFIGPLSGERAGILGDITLIDIGDEILWSYFAS